MVDGKVHEPVEHVTIDVPEEFVGNVTTLLATRKGTMIDMVNHGTGWVRLEWRIPARGLVGIRTEFMTETRGAGMMHSNFDGYAPWFGDIRLRQNGVLVADRRGDTTGNALIDLEQRGTLFVGPGVEVYEGMIVGENARSDEMNVNPTKEKKLTNMRASGSDNTERITPPTIFSLEQALEFIADDEAVEVTPKSVRLRKVVFDQAARRALAQEEVERPSTRIVPGGMTERPNVPVLKTGVGLPTVGSNPTPSATSHRSRPRRDTSQRDADKRSPDNARTHAGAHARLRDRRQWTCCHEFIVTNERSSDRRSCACETPRATTPTTKPPADKNVRRRTEKKTNRNLHRRKVPLNERHRTVIGESGRMFHARGCAILLQGTSQRYRWHGFIADDDCLS